MSLSLTAKGSTQNEVIFFFPKVTVKCFGPSPVPGCYVLINRGCFGLKLILIMAAGLASISPGRGYHKTQRIDAVNIMQLQRALLSSLVVDDSG